MPHVFLCVRTTLYLLRSNTTFLSSEIILKQSEHVPVVSATNNFFKPYPISTWKMGLKKLFSISHYQSADIWEAQKWCFFRLWLATIPPNNWYAQLNFIMFYLQHSAKGSMGVCANVLVHAYLFVKQLNVICLLQCSNPGLKNLLKFY